LARALQASSFLAMVITGIALALLVVGLVLSARPELSATFGLTLTAKDGLAIALACGAVAIAAAVLSRVLNLLRDNLSDGNDRTAQ
jgi:hypothetical protein